MSKNSGKDNNTPSVNDGENNYCYIAGYDAGSGANFSVEEGNDIISETINAAYCELTGQNEIYGQGYKDGMSATNPNQPK